MVAVTHLTTASSTASATSYTTDSITPTASRLIIADIATARSGGGHVPTLAGCGLTWVQDSTITGGFLTLTRFRAMGTPSTGQVTITVAANQTACLWSLYELSDVDTSGTNGSGAIVQTAAGTATDTTSLTVTLTNAVGAGNATIGAFTVGAEDLITPGSGYTLIGRDTEAGPASAVMSEWRATGQQAVNASWTTISTSIAGLGSEVKAAAGAAPAQGSATGTWTATGTATGRTERRGTATGTWTAAGTGTGATARRGTATGAAAWAGTATGTTPAIGASEGEATGSHTWTGSAQGMAPAADESAGTATGAHAWTGTATGRRTSTGTASTGWTATGSATGRTTAGGTAAAAHTWAGTATGTSAGIRDVTVTATLRRGWDADLADRHHTATLTGRAWTARLLPLNEHAGSTP